MEKKIKKTISCAEVSYDQIDVTRNLNYIPKIGDVALFEVLEIGKHKTVQSESKRNVAILKGDFILAAFANRYATAQFEGYIPEQPTEILDILGAGGAIGLVKSKNAAFEDIEPTKLKLVGYAINDSKEIVNTLYFNSTKSKFRGEVPNNAKVFLSIGSTMDSGKTTTAAYLARGLKQSNKKVAFIKLTGTCYTKDKDLVYDCGADVSIDFVNAGYPSTFMISKEDILDIYQTLLDSLAAEKPDYIVMEIADGLVQRETEFLLRDTAFMKTIDKVILSCGDSLAAFWGISFLSDLGYKPSIIAGRFTMSPLLIEEVENRVDIPVKTLEGLMNEDIIDILDN
ncbi:MAG: hypothetical protein EBS86_03365 [Crocinitomicaceae bacterium]|nr:hypothetical protein [Crocinitomicaceae bacterium]